MNKTIKILSILMIAIVLVTIASPAVMAGAVKPGDITPDYSVNTDGFAKAAAKILGAIRNIAAIISVIIIAVLGIKYMIGSTEERADYKKSFIPLIVGIVVVLAATTIATTLFSVLG